MLKTLLIKLYKFMIQRKDGEISLPGLKRHTRESYFVSFELDKPCEKLALIVSRLLVTNQILYLCLS